MTGDIFHTTVILQWKSDISERLTTKFMLLVAKILFDVLSTSGDFKFDMF